MARRAIDVQRLSKRYRLGRRPGQYETLRAAISSPFGSRGSRQREIWALRDVSIGIDEGEAVGVIGRNGAGKTTLLKILARITEPTLGVSRTRGRVGSLLEVGTGFHNELSGRDNIYLNGAILGMSRRDVRHRFTDIVDFAGIAPFLDTPLKRYSTGMQLRLAFSVAAHLEPDIVLVDEVLAVGDLDFQQKCVGRISELGREGRTVVFVSHQLGPIRRFCHRSIWLNEGKVQVDGRTDDVVAEYLQSFAPSGPTLDTELDPAAAVAVLWAGLTDSSRDDDPRSDRAFVVRVRFRVQEWFPDLDVAIYLLNGDGVIVANEAWRETDGVLTRWNPPQEFEASLTVPPVLSPGDYVVGFWCASTDEELFYRELLKFTLREHLSDTGGAVDHKRVIRCGSGLRLRPL